ncbi:MAG: ATPase [Deltaproteobacteria bacterium]|uniref:ATPase n=1 Tax=Candidatus Zymogenus saltonus TaxID=2844893 RepID=A0A9D8KDC9_9DELT|nr:ATPase [Candidatus Zymogenus saltonus]
MKIKKIVIGLILLNVLLVTGMTGVMMFGILTPTESYGFQTDTETEGAPPSHDVATGTGGGGVSDQVKSWGYIAAALATGFSCIAGGIAVSGVGSAAMGALSEKPDLAGRALIFVGLAEGVCIYGLIISIMILGKLG